MKLIPVLVPSQFCLSFFMNMSPQPFFFVQFDAFIHQVVFFAQATAKIILNYCSVVSC